MQTTQRGPLPASRSRQTDRSLVKRTIDLAAAAFAWLPEVRIATAESLKEVRASGRRYVLMNGKIVLYPDDAGGGA